MRSRFHKIYHYLFPFYLLGMILLGVILPSTGFSYQRIISLNTAATPILRELELSPMVVGVTYNDEAIPGKTTVGSHLSPNIELIKVLDPDLMIVGSKRAFPDRYRSKIDVKIFRYDPRSLDDILETIKKLGRLLGKVEQANRIVQTARTKLGRIHKTDLDRRIVFEISQRPLKVAGEQNIVTSLIKAAGGVNVIQNDLKHVLISAETVLLLKPDIYLYQNGPMNKNPVPPGERSFFRTLRSRVIEVDQLQFTRPGLNVFDAVLELNRLIIEE